MALVGHHGGRRLWDGVVSVPGIPRFTTGGAGRDGMSEKITITQEQADEIDRRICDGSCGRWAGPGDHDIARDKRLGYPPFRLTSWDDRVAYHAYVVRVLADMVAR